MADIVVKTPLQIVVVNDGLILIENESGSTIIQASISPDNPSVYVVSDARDGDNLDPIKQNDVVAQSLDEAAHKMVDMAVEVLPATGYSCTVPDGVLNV